LKDYRLLQLSQLQGFLLLDSDLLELRRSMGGFGHGDESVF